MTDDTGAGLTFIELATSMPKSMCHVHVAVHLTVTVHLSDDLRVQAGLEASPAGGGGWAGAREACTAAPDGGSPSVVRSTEVLLTLLSW
jgi:hypothetical protein